MSTKAEREENCRLAKSIVAAGYPMTVEFLAGQCISLAAEIDECKAVIAFLRHPGRGLDAKEFVAVLDRADKLLEGEP